MTVIGDAVLYLWDVLTALRLGRKFLDVELKPEYMAMEERRIRQAWKHRPSLFPAAEVEPQPALFQGGS